MCRSIYIDIVVTILYQVSFLSVFFRAAVKQKKKKNPQPGQLPLFLRSIAKTWCCLTIFTHNNNIHKYIKSCCIWWYMNTLWVYVCDLRWVSWEGDFGWDSRLFFFWQLALTSFSIGMNSSMVWVSYFELHRTNTYHIPFPPIPPLFSSLGFTQRGSKGGVVHAETPPPQSQDWLAGWASDP